jgi:hypothetical protein
VAEAKRLQAQENEDELEDWWRRWSAEEQVLTAEFRAESAAQVVAAQSCSRSAKQQRQQRVATSHAAAVEQAVASTGPPGAFHARAGPAALPSTFAVAAGLRGLGGATTRVGWVSPACRTGCATAMRRSWRRMPRLLRAAKSVPPCTAAPRVFYRAACMVHAWCVVHLLRGDRPARFFLRLYRLDCTVVLYRILRSQSAACWLLDRLANSDMLLSSRCCMHECSGCWRGRAPCSVNVEILQAISYGEILGNRGSVLGHTILGSSGLLFCSYSCIDCS